MAESEVKGSAPKGPGLCCTERSDGLSPLFFNVLRTIIAAWCVGLPRSIVRPVSMALPYVWEAILSAEAIPSLTTVPPTAGTAVGVAEAEQVSLYR